MKKTITIGAAAIALLAATGAQGGCGGPAANSSPTNGRTISVPGDTNEAVTCNQTPYDVVLDVKEGTGSGIVVSRGYVRGAMWVLCTGAGPDSWTITVQLLRNGLPVGTGSAYTALPNSIGYSADVFTKCVPGVYRLQYRYRWTLQGVVQSDTNTAPTNETVTAHDCDA